MYIFGGGEKGKLAIVSLTTVHYNLTLRLPPL